MGYGTVTSDDDAGIPSSGKRNSFYYNGLFWVFYNDGSNLVFRTSDDGVNWSSETSFATAVYTIGDIFSIFFDGTKVHYTQGYGGDIYYRSGTPNVDGTITWTAAEIAVVSGGDNRRPTITVDTNGYVWIGYYTSNDCIIIRSGNTDGTWGITGVTSTLEGSATFEGTNVVSLTSGKIYVLYENHGKLYNSGWGSEETTGIVNENSHLFSPVSIDDDIYVVYNNETESKLYMKKRTYGVGWGSGIEISSSDTLGCISLDTLSDKLYIFYISDTDLKYKIYNTETDELSEEYTAYISTDMYLFISSSYDESDGYIACCGIDESKSPDEIILYFIDITGVYLVEGNGAGPTWTMVNEVRFQSADRYDADIDYPIKIEDSGYSYSYWKHLALKLVGNFTQVSNIRHYCDGTIGWALGTDGRVVRGNRDSGDNGCPEVSYDQATGSEGESGDELGANHSYYSGQTTKVSDIESDTSGSPATIDSSEYTSADISKAIVLQVRVDDDATQGLTADETFTFLYDEI